MALPASCIVLRQDLASNSIMVAVMHNDTTNMTTSFCQGIDFIFFRLAHRHRITVPIALARTVYTMPIPDSTTAHSSNSSSSHNRYWQQPTLTLTGTSIFAATCAQKIQVYPLTTLPLIVSAIGTSNSDV